MYNWTVTNQSENETNKNADKNRLRGYRFCSVDVCQQSKTENRPSDAYHIVSLIVSLIVS